MVALAGGTLLVLAAVALLINLYFTSLALRRWPGLRRRLGSLFNACGADTSTCAIVFETPYARIFGGVPNVYAGLLWCAALLALAVHWLVDGRLVVPWPYLFVAAGTIVVGGYLIWALQVVLKQPCPL